jgi:RimK family alpha-L-glutamate ligase
MAQASPKRIAIFIDNPDWHARRLATAFAARGLEAVFVPLRSCRFETGGGGLILPGFETGLPEGGFVRCVPGGSFEQVTLRLGVLHGLAAAGVPLCNDARAIERCVDKSMTSLLLTRAGLPTPDTWVTESLEEATTILRREAGRGWPLVLKPLFGSQGRGLKLVARPSDLPAPEAVAGVYYLQRFVPTAAKGWRDWRLLVAGGRPVAAMVRHGVQWITNAHQGARCEAAGPAPELEQLAVAAARAVGADYAGVDLMEDRQGRFLVLEVNSMPAWSALQKVSDSDVTQALVDRVLPRLLQGPPLAVVGGGRREAGGA